MLMGFYNQIQEGLVILGEGEARGKVDLIEFIFQLKDWETLLLLLNIVLT